VPADPDGVAYADLNRLGREHVHQATRMLIALLHIDAAEAVVRLRAHAYASGRTATEVAHDILDHQLRLEAD
jgi:AmiR/NasT family two-component response regulator